MKDEKDNYLLYMENADDMLEVAQANFKDGFYRSACNRAYYGIFYAASALLFSKGKSYGKHSAVLAAFRQYFIKTKEFAETWSDDYQVIMDSRHVADYDLYDHLEKEEVAKIIMKSRKFIEEVRIWLQKHELL